MKQSACQNPDCTFNETGLCVMEYDFAECPNLVDHPETQERIGDEVDPGDVSEKDRKDTVALPLGNPLTLEEVGDLMRDEYCLVVGLLGEPDTGKTACIVSLYLLLSQAMLNRYSFSNSRSLLALDYLARGARSWAGAKSRQMTVHTKLVDGTAASFLHFKLRCEDGNDPVNLIVSEAPGEWTANLIDRNRTDRFGFLKSVEAIWLMIDGRELLKPERTRQAIHRADTLLSRIVLCLVADVPAVHLVVSHLDSGDPPEEVKHSLREMGAKYQISLTINYIASFSNNPAITAGTGIADLIRATVGKPVEAGGLLPASGVWTLASVDRRTNGGGRCE